MSSSDRRVCLTLALIALVSVAGATPAYARGEEHRAAEGERHAAPRREAEVRQNHRAEAPRAAGVRAAQARQTYHAPEHPVAAHAQVASHPQAAVHPQVAANTSFHAHSYAAAAPARVVHWGGAQSGTVERSIRPGFVSRTFVSGGHVMYTHVYQQHVWHQFGRSFAYETYVPAVRFPAAYYGWALSPWAHPVAYSWGWRAQAWYPTYGVLFTPYPVYTSPDLWMTDYILAQNMQAAYQAQVAYQAQGYPPPGAPPAPSNYVDPAAAPGATSGGSGYVDPAAAPGATAADSGYVDPAAAPGAVAPDPAAPAPAAPTSTGPPPAITPQIKAQLDAQIKVRLEEQQQAATAVPATLTTDSGPPALKANHVFFQVVQPLDVPSGANRHCTLSANDYIKRTGGMSDDDWQVPVVVELSGPSDCAEGLRTRIGLNDLNAMENEQEAQVLEAMRAASKSMGPNGPPSGPGTQPSLIVDGSATPDPEALQAFRQAQ